MQQARPSHLPLRLGHLQQIRRRHVFPLEVHKFLPLALTNKNKSPETSPTTRSLVTIRDYGKFSHVTLLAHIHGHNLSYVPAGALNFIVHWVHHPCARRPFFRRPVRTHNRDAFRSARCCSHAIQVFRGTLVDSRETKTGQRDSTPYKKSKSFYTTMRLPTNTTECHGEILLCTQKQQPERHRRIFAEKQPTPALHRPACTRQQQQ